MKSTHIQLYQMHEKYISYDGHSFQYCSIVIVGEVIFHDISQHMAYPEISASSVMIYEDMKYMHRLGPSMPRLPYRYRGWFQGPGG